MTRSRPARQRALLLALLHVFHVSTSAAQDSSAAPVAGGPEAESAPAAAESAPPATESAPPAESNDASSEARRHFSRAVELYAESEFALALAEFDRAYEILPNVHVLYNIGQLCFELRKYARARAVLERYLVEARTELPPERASAVERDLAGLAARTAVLRIRADVADAEVFIDGMPARNAGRDGFILDVGERSVRVSKAGHQSAERHGTFAGGDSLDWDFQLPVLPAPVPAAAPASVAGPALPPESQALPAVAIPAAPERSMSWVPWAITSVLAAGWATAGVITLDKQAHKNELEADGATPEGQLDEAAGSLKTWAIVTDVLLGAALASAGVSAYLTFVVEPAGSGDPSAASGGGAHPSGARYGLGVSGTIW